MKSKLEKFGKFEVIKNQALNVLGGQQFACHFEGGYQFIVGEEAVANLEAGGAECFPYYDGTINN